MGEGLVLKKHLMCRGESRMSAELLIQLLVLILMIIQLSSRKS